MHPHTSMHTHVISFIFSCSITHLAGVYKEGEFHPDNAWLYLAIVNALSQAVCVCVCVCVCVICVCVFVCWFFCMCALCAGTYVCMYI